MGTDDKKKDASKNKDDKKKIDGESVTVVLKLDLHCEGCAKKVKSSIRHFEGVESVNVDMAGNKIMITGKVDPARVKERIEKKTKKKVEMVSPQVKKDDKKYDEKSPDKKSDDKKADAKKPKEIQTSTVDLVLVKGTMNVNELVPHLKQKFKREVDVVLPKKDEKSDEKKDVKKEIKFEEVDKKEKGNNGGDGEKKKDGDKDKKKDEVKADASKSIQVVNKLEHHGQNPFTYTMPMYNQNYYNQDYGISTSNHGYENMGYANHGYAMQYSNGPPPPPPMYIHDSRGLDTGMFSDENPNAACSIM
uniref:Heavy metal-associated domain, HMA n=1 Tax=Tanacetum cinerariifolium TaxID=118510 RepID=A0A6L2MXF6_TANCI|nr:heavy metal-associated domain, HMA [Tanacetum cinerariifolium]